MKITVQMISIIQCRKCCSSAILVTGREVQLIDHRASGQKVLNSMDRGTPKPCTGHQQQRRQLIGNALFIVPSFASPPTNPRSAPGQATHEGRAGFLLSSASNNETVRCVSTEVKTTKPTELPRAEKITRGCAPNQVME